MEEVIFLQDFAAKHYQLPLDDSSVELKCCALLFSVFCKLPPTVRFNSYSNVFTVCDVDAHTDRTVSSGWIVFTAEEAMAATTHLLHDVWSAYPAHVLSHFAHVGYTSPALEAIRNSMGDSFARFFIIHCLAVPFPVFMSSFSSVDTNLTALFLAVSDHKCVPIKDPSTGTAYIAYRVV